MSPVPEIDLDAAKRHLEQDSALFVDIRDPRSFASGRIPGALRLDNASVQAFLDETPRDRTVIVCCYHGNSSRGATSFLIEQGFATAYSLRGGFEAWREQFEFEAD